MEKKTAKPKMMYVLSLFILSGLLLLSFCSTGGQKDAVGENPFFSEFDTPFKVPPFQKIKAEHYMPAFKEAMKREQEEIAAIVNNADAPTFANTLVALDNCGVMLSEVSAVFNNLKSADINDQLRGIANEVTPLLSKHRDDIKLNEKLFQRIKAVYDQKDQLKLSPEQLSFLDKKYKEFVRGGANLPAEKKAKLREFNKELSLLSLKFSDNQLKETNAFKLVIETKDGLSGLPSRVIDTAAKAANEEGLEGKWVFTLQKPSMIPFLQFSDKRELREKIYTAYINRCNNDNEYDNKKIAARIAALRVEKANLLGYETHAHYVLEKNMAKEPANVFKLLNQLWDAAIAQAKKELVALQGIADKEGGDFKIQPWDWWYYAEKLKKEKYDLDDSALRPYFKLENVRDGLFMVGNRLFGLNFVQRIDIPKYHKDAHVFEVQEADGTHLGILYMDFFPRASKRGGAWMNSYRKQSRRGGKQNDPVVTNVLNFTKPTATEPSLLSLDEVSTMFHEFGHALHGLLSNCTYYEISGTSVPRDFVELPSSIMENWATHPEVMKLYAKHYKTGEVIPQELIDKIEKSGLFNQGFILTEYLAAALLDMNYHTLKEAKEVDVPAFEAEALGKIGLIPEIISRYRSTYFRHIFASGYSSGYYSYIWSEVLDADAFEAFKENGLFDKDTAKALRAHILSRGGSEDPMVLYKRFRGSEPSIDPLLKRKGFK
jgi:peptidyl-dipeptidase Dcp